MKRSHPEMKLYDDCQLHIRYGEENRLLNMVRCNFQLIN